MSDPRMPHHDPGSWDGVCDECSGDGECEWAPGDIRPCEGCGGTGGTDAEMVAKARKHTAAVEQAWFGDEEAA